MAAKSNEPEVEQQDVEEDVDHTPFSDPALQETGLSEFGASDISPGSVTTTGAVITREHIYGGDPQVAAQSEDADPDFSDAIDEELDDDDDDDLDDGKYSKKK